MNERTWWQGSVARCLGWLVVCGALGHALASHYTGAYAAEGVTLNLQHDERGTLQGELPSPSRA